MSGYSNLRGSEVRAKLDYPIIDADAHIVECNFALMDCLEQVGGKALAARAAAASQNAGAHGASVKGFWWGLSSGEHTSDRALAMLPRYFRSRMDELGIDFAHCYTTLGLAHVYIVDDELRQATCRALNVMYADMFRDVGDRLRPVAVIPTYTPEEAIRELDYAVNELGFKAVMIGTELRGPGQDALGNDPRKFQTQSTRSIVMDRGRRTAQRGQAGSDRRDARRACASGAVRSRDRGVSVPDRAFQQSRDLEGRGRRPRPEEGRRLPDRARRARAGAGKRPRRDRHGGAHRPAR